MQKQKRGNGAVDALLQKSLVRKVKWTADSRLLIWFAPGPQTWGQLKEISDEAFMAWAEDISRVALDSGAGVLDCWWDVQYVRGAGFVPAEEEEADEDGWFFSFQVSAKPPGGREHTWLKPRQIALLFKTAGCQQQVIRGEEETV